MPAPDLNDLMVHYARQGIAHWNSAGRVLRNKANHILGNAIADTEWEATQTIYKVSNQGDIKRPKFIPMPNVPGARGIERCFFLPVREITAIGQDTTFFELFLLVEDNNCLAFRFEPADAPPSTHGYGHVQLSRTMASKSIAPTEILRWLPDSYPAFPLPSSDPLKMFLSMATAIHGYEGGMTRVLQEIFQNRPSFAAFYRDELKKLLQ